jgi:hypothetical protein
MTRTRLILLALVGALAVYLGVSALIPSDTKRIRRLIEKGRQAVVERDLNKVMSIIDRTYEDDFGFNYAILRGWFHDQFQVYDRIACTIPLMSVEVHGRQAVCRLAFWFTGYGRGSNEEDAFGDGAPVYQDKLVITLEKFPEGWLVTGAGQ